MNSENNVIRIGILGTASVARYALIAPARSRSDCKVIAVASRDASRAASYASKNGIPRSFGTYEGLLGDPQIDVIYVALPNHMHAEWSIRAMEAGKHVLCEKPMASNADEARRMLEVSSRTGKILMEALHSTHHPLYARLRDIIRSGELGELSKVRVDFCSLLPFRNNIRFKYELAGGANMDLGCYSVQLIRYVLGEELEVERSSARLTAPEVDGRIDAVMKSTSGIDVEVACSLIEMPWNIRMKIEVTGDKGVLKSLNPFAPHLFHTIRVRSVATGKSRSEKVAKAPSSYAHQLECFLALVRGVRAASPSSAEEAIRTLAVMDAMYIKAGLRVRGLSAISP
jgi:predicted dehydrogenase